ncbi:MAG: hypothetical protein P1V18_05630 [Candidatus Gracilibacteria bacterium]|nr:hypothetical protein [Candidatus Gracilibacteria bacterium]
MNAPTSSRKEQGVPRNALQVLQKLEATQNAQKYFENQSNGEQPSRRELITRRDKNRAFNQQRFSVQKQTHKLLLRIVREFKMKELLDLVSRNNLEVMALVLGGFLEKIECYHLDMHYQFSTPERLIHHFGFQDRLTEVRERAWHVLNGTDEILPLPETKDVLFLRTGFLFDLKDREHVESYHDAREEIIHPNYYGDLHAHLERLEGASRRVHLIDRRKGESLSENEKKIQTQLSQTFDVLGRGWHWDGALQKEGDYIATTITHG